MDNFSAQDINRLQQQMRDLATSELAESAIDRDREGEFWEEGWKACAAAGVLTLPANTRLGPRALVLPANTPQGPRVLVLCG